MIGTTPIHRIKIPFDTSLVDRARIVYHQWGKEVLRKETEDFHMEGNVLSVSLSQEETFLFDCTPIVIQLRVRDTSGFVHKMKPRTITPDDCLDREVL
jgi:hypothetical protein